MRMRKFMTTLVIVIVFISLSTTQALAVDNANNPPSISQSIGIEPMWNENSGAEVYLNFTAGEANCSGRITGRTDTTSITATFILYESTTYGWKNVSSWTESSYSNRLNFSARYSAVRGKTYRLSVTGTVYGRYSSDRVFDSVEKTNY